MAKAQKKRLTVLELLALAAEPVPLGSGLGVYGRGPHKYMKANRLDGSARVFCFRSARIMARAMTLGVEADDEPEPEGAATVDPMGGEQRLH